jgi:hypothetical protein
MAHGWTEAAFRKSKILEGPPHENPCGMDGLIEFGLAINQQHPQTTLSQQTGTA